MPCIMGDLATVIFHYADSSGAGGSQELGKEGVFYHGNRCWDLPTKKEVCNVEKMHFLLGGHIVKSIQMKRTSIELIGSWILETIHLC